LIPDWSVHVIAVFEVLIFAPLLKGAINHWKARIQSRSGSPYLQPYYDLAKLFRKDMVISRETSWLVHVVPLVYYVVPLEHRSGSRAES